MRRIDQHQIQADVAWDRKAATEKAKVAAGTPVSKCQDVWGEAKERLKRVSNGKCWYCESRQSRSDNAVDHYRPKSVYPWLAYDLSNFRYACTYCNSIRRNPETGELSGKGDHFPLFNGARATTPAQLNAEDVVLVDPCKGGDPGLLDFRADGWPCAKYPAQAKRKDRAERSIRYYHLDHPDLVEARRLLALQIKDWVDGADALYKILDQGDLGTEQAFSRITESICRAISERAELSVFARRMVEGYKDRPWIDDLLRYA